MTILVSLIALGIMIAVHEAGHLLSAKLCGVYVKEFAIGMGPKLLCRQGKETIYSLRLFPIGGFCNLDEEDEGSPRHFVHAEWWKKLLILVSGALMNLILAFILLLCFYSSQPLVAEPVIKNVIPDSYAAEVGLMPGDRIVKMDGTQIHFYPDISFFLARNGDTVMDLTVERNGKKILFENYRCMEQNGAKYIGIQLQNAENSFWKTIQNSFYLEMFMGKVVFAGFFDLIEGKASVNDVTGLVGITKEIGDAAKTGWMDLLYIVSLITVNLGLFNLLPFPALDGGRILFVLISVIIRRPIPEKFENYFHACGMLLLLILMVFVTCNDIGRLIR